MWGWLGLFSSLLKPEWRSRIDEYSMRVFVLSACFFFFFVFFFICNSLAPFSYTAFPPTEKRVSPPHYFTIIDDQNRSTKPTVRSHFNSLVFSYITSGCITHCNFSTFLHALMLIATTWQMWASPKLAGLTLDSVWVMKAITPTVTLTCHSGVVYCRLQLCPSLTYTEVVNTISTSGEDVWARHSMTAAAAKQLCSHNESHVYVCARHQRTLFRRL